MSDAQLIALLDALDPVELGELDSTAALLTRRDRKYIVPEAVAARLLECLADSSRVLEMGGRRRFHYESVYFDTPEDASYLAAARRRPDRYKVRTRAYLDSGLCRLEVKTRDPRGRTVKARNEHPIDIRHLLDRDGRDFVGRCALIGDRSRALAPALITRYTRATLLVGDARSRLTLDSDVEALAPDGGRVTLADMAIVETKSVGPPSEADRALWSLGHRPIRVSKYCTSLALLRPELPSNKWTRALRLPWQVSGHGDREIEGEADWRLARAG